MTVLAELGPHNWQDYTDFWREQDAEWLQARSILRVDTFNNLPTTVTTPGIGQVVYVKDVAGAGTAKDVLYMYASEGGGVGVPGWKQYAPFPKNLAAKVDSNAQVLLGHHTGNPAAAVDTLAFSPTGLNVVSDFSVKTTVFKVTVNDLQIKIGSNKLVTLTTDATSLVSDSPIKAPSFTSTTAMTVGTTLNVVGATTVAALTASGVVTAPSLVVNGPASAAQYTSSGATTAGGLKAGGGQYYGDANGAVIQRIAGGPQILVNTALEFKGGVNMDVDNQLRVMSGRPIEFRNAANTATLGFGGPVFVGPTDPGGMPNGTIWVQT
jgi:hypothetical protein